MALPMPDDASGQRKSWHPDEYLKILPGFHNTETRVEIIRSGRETIVFEGVMDFDRTKKKLLEPVGNGVTGVTTTTLHRSFWKS